MKNKFLNKHAHETRKQENIKNIELKQEDRVLWNTKTHGYCMMRNR